LNVSCSFVFVGFLSRLSLIENKFKRLMALNRINQKKVDIFVPNRSYEL